MLKVIIKKICERIEFALLRRHQETSVRLRKIFRARHRVDVGLYSYGCFDQWRMPGPIRVGRWCSIANSVRSAPGNHRLDAITTHPALYDPRLGVVEENTLVDALLIIEDDVWIGHNAMILPGCKLIGRGAVIGGGAIVTRDVPPYAVVAGNPARLLRHRFAPAVIEALEESRWWELDAAGLRELVETQPELVFHPGADSLRAWTAERQGRLR